VKKLMRSSGGRLGETRSVELITQLMEGFRVMIEKNYIHRDVKPENALIKDNICKLADFGFAAKADF
jgi:calcium-dependent protein kinase